MAPAEAGVFSISPVRIYMTPRVRAVAVTISNEGDSEVLLEADLQQWTQRPDGADALTSTDDLVLAPPTMRIPARSQQVVRLALLRALDPARQLSYRMTLREVNRPVAEQGSMQVPVALALSLPVFVTPAQVKRDVDCFSLLANGRTAEVTCRNSGASYAQVRQAVLRREAQEIARFSGGNYILAGASKPLTLSSDGNVPAGPATLTVSYDDGGEQVFHLVSP